MQKAMNGNVKVTKGIFDAVKLLLASGAKYAEIMKYFNLSKATISYINHAESHEEYLIALQVHNERNRKAVAAIKAKEKEQTENPVSEKAVSQVVQVQLPYTLTQEMKRQNALLEGISNKLAFIVQELCGVKVNAESDN